MVKMEEENNKGAPISITWDKENGDDFINIREQDGSLIMKIKKSLWDGDGIIGFTPVIRDSIINEVRRLFG